MNRIADVTILAVAIVICTVTRHLAAADDAEMDSTFRCMHIAADHTGNQPYITHKVHTLGRLHLTITNWGVFGNPMGILTDPVTGLRTPGATFPSADNFEYLACGALWIGALVPTIRGDDTLVSTAFTLTEFYPTDYGDGGDISIMSSDPNNPFYDKRASSSQEYHCEYSDTLTDPAYVPLDEAALQRHSPLNIRIRQNSYVWSYEYAEDFVIIQYWITNMRREVLHGLRIGIWVYPEVHHLFNTAPRAGRDNMVGYLEKYPSITGHGVEIPIKTAWWADNDGDPGRLLSWNELSTRSAMGIRFVGLSNVQGDDLSEPEYSFNWWADWGPQRKPGDRSITGKCGSPIGDQQKYRYMANKEIDYDQYLAHDEMPGWITPPAKAITSWPPYNLADGAMVSFLLSTGPYDLAPGDSIPIGLAVVAGDYFHRDPNNKRNLNSNGQEWYNNLDFSALASNAQRADITYDNPGVDTDGDGNRGKYFTVNCREIDTCLKDYCFYSPDTVYCYDERCFTDYIACDTIFYAGDGIPDLKGPSPPPSPQITIHTQPHTIRMVWTGRDIENFYDPFALCEDFEGYNVYAGIGDNPDNMTLMASWDLVNFDRYRYIPTARPSPWVLDGPPLTLEQIAAQHDPFVNPADYRDKFSPYQDDDGNLFYFQPHGGNRGNEYLEGGMITSNPIQYVRTDSLLDESSQTWKYFGHYECTIDNLLPSQPYYFAVTAFDAGVAAGGIESLESPVQANMQLAYPTYSPEYVEEQRLPVSVYPNPYKIDAGYREMGYEDPNREGFKERTRRIHFVNLPPECIIKIFSLDGDLIRELHHPSSRFSDTPSHTAWDLITRNTQAVTSGIYLYSVESDWGTHIGKIVIIK